MSRQDLSLSPEQRKLLQAALVSNQPVSKSIPTTHQQDSTVFTPDMSDRTAPGSGHLDFSDESPYLDFGLDGDFDESFTYDQNGQMIGDLSDDSPGADLHEKRKSIDGKDDDDEGGGKRREGDDKLAKKPGRKPLLNEPTNKRKAQNRAAQRAFRERKERHLKDLETKLEEMEKASESTSHEKELLRAENEKLKIELREYRKRLSWITNSTTRQGPGHVGRTSTGGSDFQFEFPKFGDLPTANFAATNSANQNGAVSRASPTQTYSTSPVPSAVPRQQSFGSVGNSPLNNNHTYSASPQPLSTSGRAHKNSADSLSGLFSPSILDTARHNSISYFPDGGRSQNRLGGRTSFDAHGPVPGLTTSSTNTDSPGSSADSQQHLSSIGTSPEPLFNSPNIHKPEYSLNVVNGNDQMGVFGTQDFSADLNNNGFDWLAQQNGGHFDPVLFGDYRESQDNVLSQDFGSFFNDAYPLPELGSPSHNYGDVAPSTVSSNATKPDLMKQVDAAKDGELDKTKMLTCNKIWDRLQTMEKFRNGEIDIDNLCSELRAKAKCSEGGAVVEEKHVNKLLNGL